MSEAMEHRAFLQKLKAIGVQHRSCLHDQYSKKSEEARASIFLEQCDLEEGRRHKPAVKEYAKAAAAYKACEWETFPPPGLVLIEAVGRHKVCCVSRDPRLCFST